MPQCELCDKKIDGQAQFCSRDCEYEMIEMSGYAIPIGWVRKTLKRLGSMEERDREIARFAKMHKYNLRLLRIQLKKKYSVNIKI